ncbi:MFS transporter [Nonomuraea sp. NPDC004580]|uniref:MFS transporter n=1 Tax=Nonomuraea sp. NPDC004580 TaxID=3154552 RepID=UPI0033BB7084
MLETQPAARRTFSWRVVALAMLLCGWGGNQFTPLLLMYRRLGGYSTLDVDAFLGAYVVGLVPGLLLAGPVSDRRGRRPVLAAGTAASALASLVLCFGAQSAWAIYAGRLLTGVAVGIAMAVGSSWVKELSAGEDGALPARRASLCQTAGFGLGAGVAGALAQWGPWPMVSPYVVHVLLTVAVPVLLLRVPETRTPSPDPAGLLSPWLAAAAAAVLGMGYGIAVVSGLLEIQRMAGADDLAGLTGVYYMLAYTGFLLPALLAGLSAWLPYPIMLTAVAGVALICLAVVATGVRVTART